MTVEAGGNPRWIRANNPGPFTLDGTRTYIVGHRQVAVIDPGPDMDAHVRAVALAVADADQVTVLLSHGHGDHSDGVSRLMGMLPKARLVGNGHPGCDPIPSDPTGDHAGAAPVVAETDVGSILAVATPGHTVDHLCFHWPEGRTLFAADMVLGEGDTTWVAEYSGCVADYLESLDRLEALELERVFSAHGPVIEDVPEVWQRYRAHRLSRIEATRSALQKAGVTAAQAARPQAIDAFLNTIYGNTIPAGLRGAALDSLRAVLDYLESHG